jgi:acetyl esterase/lipase
VNKREIVREWTELVVALHWVAKDLLPILTGKENLDMSKKRMKPRKRVWLISIIIIILLVLAVLIIGQFTPVVTAFLLKQPINAYSFKPPPNFETIQQQVIVHKDIPYNSKRTLLDIYSPKNITTPVPVIMFVHGGGFIGGKKENTQAYAMTLASAGYVVANINYDLAPGYKYPVPVIEANQALGYLRENIGQFGGDINRVFLSSNSAGSHIAGQMAVLITNHEFANRMGIQPAITKGQLKGVLLYDGVYNMRSAQSLHSSVIDLYTWSYTGVRDIQTFDRADELSIPDHITPDFPPTFITVGDADLLEPQSIELIQALDRNGVEVESHLFTDTGAGLGHDFMMDLSTQPAQQILKQALDFLKRHSEKTLDNIPPQYVQPE